jgi:hypothetical protein
MTNEQYAAELEAKIIAAILKKKGGKLNDYGNAFIGSCGHRANAHNDRQNLQSSKETVKCCIF